MADLASTTPDDIENELSTNTDLSYVLPANNVRDVVETPVRDINQGAGGIRRST